MNFPKNASQLPSSLSPSPSLFTHPSDVYASSLQRILPYLISQLLLGLLLNLIIILSISKQRSKRQSVLSSASNEPTADNCRQQRTAVPVIDVVLLLFSIVAILRGLVKGGLQIVCAYGFCLIRAGPCSIHGYISTLLQYYHLWILTLLIQDRYISNYSPAAYTGKCNATLLHLTLILSLTLLAYHLFGPVYGFSSYTFHPQTVTCSIDWSGAPYSCPYFSYTLLLALAPVLAPLSFWTLKMIRRTLGEVTSTLRCCKKVDVPRKFPKSTTFRQLSQNNLELRPLAQQAALSTTRQASTESTSSTQARVRFTSDSPNFFAQSSAQFNFAQLNFNRVQSLVLAPSHQILVCILVSGLTLGTVGPQLVGNFTDACLGDSPSEVFQEEDGPSSLAHASILEGVDDNYQQEDETFANFSLSYQFLLSFAEDTVACLLIPLVLILFNRKLRFFDK